LSAGIQWSRSSDIPLIAASFQALYNQPTPNFKAILAKKKRGGDTSAFAQKCVLSLK